MAVEERQKSLPYSQATMRNMTGLYLSLEGIKDPDDRKHKSILPHVMKSRGQGRFVSAVQQPYKLGRRGETYRLSAERRGFTGLPLKRKLPSISGRPDSTNRERPVRGNETSAALWDIENRHTHRQFTLITSSSTIPRMEYLKGPPGGESLQSEEVLPAHLVISDLKKFRQPEALVACYRNILKDDSNSLSVLLPKKQPDTHERSKSPRELQNPKTAQLLASFPDLKHKPKRPQSMNPGRSSNPSRSATSNSSVQARSKDSTSHGMKTVRLGAPQAVDMGTAHSSSSPDLSQQHSGATVPRNTAGSRPGDRAESPHTPPQGQGGENRVQISLPEAEQEAEGPLASVLESTTDAESAAAAVAQHLEACGTAFEVCSTTSIEIKVEQTDASSMEGRSSGILIALEDDDGSQRPIEIDEADDDYNKESPESQEPSDNEREATENAANKRRVSITERILKSKNHEQILASITEDTETRKKMLEELLLEHQQLVHELSSMEHVGTDKENKQINNTESTAVN